MLISNKVLSKDFSILQQCLTSLSSYTDGSLEIKQHDLQNLNREASNYQNFIFVAQLITYAIGKLFQIMIILLLQSISYLTLNNIPPRVFD
ncbi:unnamed protein product [Paramecium primaurelia]|uniref:Uncharacterized protein n=1 Tax=Paramecium primaurelia TaxID=5886 RepID=A0A8S1QIC5_PARPR|nr:unnamed protein product [Paramecium primaurelia]